MLPVAHTENRGTRSTDAKSIVNLLERGLETGGVHLVRLGYDLLRGSRTYLRPCVL